jgi:salicylate hydroxylase
MASAAPPAILIAGGGIGGLGVALALSKRGIASFVLEAADQFSETGAGLQIGPNGSRILRRWGLGDALARDAGRPRHLHILDGLSGRRLTSLPLGDYAEGRYGAPYFVAERRLLHLLLLEAVKARGDITLRTGFRLAAFTRNPDGIEAVAESGETARGSALIGADGVHSQVRLLQIDAAPSFSGRNAWRATAPYLANDPASQDISLWLAPHAHLVHYGCGPDGPMNAVAVTTGPQASPGWGTLAEPDRLAPFFSSWAAVSRGMLDRFDSWMVWPLLTLAPLERWTSGRVTLLGDAAHPLMPFLASGAVAAIEDAETLAAALSKSPDDPASAFAAYEAARKPRTRRIQQASRRMGEIYHMDGAMRFARNMVLSTIPASRLLARNDWLYGYCAVD